MSKFKQQVYRYYKYGHTEFYNLTEALNREIPAPNVFALGVQKKFFCQIYSALVIEDFKHYIPISEVLSRSCTDNTNQKCFR